MRKPNLFRAILQTVFQVQILGLLVLVLTSFLFAVEGFDGDNLVLSNGVGWRESLVSATYYTRPMSGIKIQLQDGTLLDGVFTEADLPSATLANSPYLDQQLTGSVHIFSIPTANIDSIDNDNGNLAGWIPCDGRSLSRTTFARLYERIGTTWGAVDGTHFSVPDLRGYFLRGLDAMGTQGAASRDTGRTMSATVQASATGYPVTPMSLNLSSVAGHIHSYWDFFWITRSGADVTVGNSYGVSYAGEQNLGENFHLSYDANLPWFDTDDYLYQAWRTTGSDSHTHTVTLSSTHFDSETRPINKAFFFFIKD
ncbi:MAG: phage tail protein [Candidatus Margulisiibacteriota bacterium]